MNTVDLLLNIDAGKLVKPTKDVEIKRLSAIAGAPVMFTCQAMDPDRYSEIQQDAVNFDKKGKVSKIDMSEMRVFMILDGVTSPDLKSKDLMDHYGVVTPKDLIKKLLLPGEMDELFNNINTLSGFDEDSDEETNSDIKNS